MKSEEWAGYLRGRLRSRGKSPYPAVYLFGMEYPEAPKGQNLKQICALADVSPNYAAELRKALELAPFVELKQ